ncbi:MAG: 8-amino-7-oxononanoate synthase [Endomicrobiales bacterium]|nr:8-amino-7-oxononanoate synthase [Endomicrobiales bacterium]
MEFEKELEKELSEAKQAGMLRKVNAISSAPAREITISGKSYLNFSSNNYLGLSFHPEVKKAAKEAIEKYGTGGTSSRLVAGTLDMHGELEEKLAKMKNTEAALVFPSGFQTNLGILSALFGEGDCIIMDRLNHASLWDAAKLSHARVFVYQHKDMNGLEKVLIRSRDYKRRLIVTDSVFSMDGDTAPLEEIIELSKEFEAVLMIDEAHATGVLGDGGRGLPELLGIEGQVDIVMGTLSKALGSQGGFVCASKAVCNYLINKCRSFIYTTALSPASTAAAIKAIDISNKEPARRNTLKKLSETFRKKLSKIGVETSGSSTQIIPAVTKDIGRTLELSQVFIEEGVFVPPIRPPTVPEGSARLRFSLTSEHTEQDLDKAVKIMKDNLI